MGIRANGTLVSWGGDSKGQVTGTPTDNDHLAISCGEAFSISLQRTDSDADGLYDEQEDLDRDGFVDQGETDPLDQDTDNDAIGDAQESAYGTSPILTDTDGDGLQDGLEVGFDAIVWDGDLDGDGTPDVGGTDPSVFTPDQDPSSTTDPLIQDTDGGGIIDGLEDTNRNGAVDTFDTNPNLAIDDDLAMYVEGVSPGGFVKFTVRQGQPNALVLPCYSIAGAGPTDVGNGLIMSLSSPIEQLATFPLDANGFGEFVSRKIPDSAPLGLPIWFQGIEILVRSGGSFRLTNGLEKPISVEG